MLKKIIVVTSLLFSTSLFAQEKLIFSLDLIRHGDRTPIKEIPASPYQWKEGLGQLTKEGEQQEIALGHQLRNRYVYQYHLLSTRYVPGTVYIRSTDIKRAIDSANAFLLGLYPMYTRGPNDTVIPVESIPHADDNVLRVKASKQPFSIIHFYFSQLRDWKNKTCDLQAQLKNWSELTGSALNKEDNLDLVADALYVRSVHHVPFPAGISDQDAQTMIELANWSMVNEFSYKELYYPMGYEFMHTITRYFDDAIQHKTPLKYVLFSAHDSTIMDVMSTMGVPLSIVPHYASHVNFALFENAGQYYVKVSYNDVMMTLPKCTGEKCEVTIFNAL